MRKFITFIGMIFVLVPLCFGTTVNAYSNEDLILLAKVINAEAGEGCSIEHNQLVGCVVMNRVRDNRFPNTIQGVVYQKGQYSCICSRKFQQYPSQIAINAAKWVLDGNAYCPSKVIYQSSTRQGKGLYKSFSYSYYQITYFCYG